MAIGKGSVNRVTLIGNLGNDPELTKTKSGAAVTSIALATNELWKDSDGNNQEHTEWHRVVFWRRLAEIVCEHLQKGSKVYIEGSMRTRYWQDKKGVKRNITEVIADKITMLDKRIDVDPQDEIPEQETPDPENEPLEPEDLPV